MTEGYIYLGEHYDVLNREIGISDKKIGLSIDQPIFLKTSSLNLSVCIAEYIFLALDPMGGDTFNISITKFMLLSFQLKVGWNPMKKFNKIDIINY